MDGAVTTPMNMTRARSGVMTNPAEGFPSSGAGAHPIKHRLSNDNLHNLSKSGTNGSGGGGGTILIGSKPTLMVSKHMRFLIMDAPRHSNLHLYIRECRRHSVTDIVRVCEPTYVAGELRNAGIELHEMAYQDGHSPPQDVLDRWLELVDRQFYSKGAGGGKGGTSHPGNERDSNGTTASSVAPPAVTGPPTIAVHCVAGLGRAPVLVAIALIEFDGMDAVDAVTMIRRHRRGAINEKQLNYLEQYRRSYKRAGIEGKCCIIQ